MYNIFIYEDNKGKSEINEYLKKLRKSNEKKDIILINKIRMYLNLLSEFGLTLGEPYIKRINREIWELRPIRNRILFAYVDNNSFVLLTHFIKKTRKTPKDEIDKAMRYLDDYKRRFL